MPLFEYQCNACQKEFELLQLPGREPDKSCPSCGSAQITQKISVFSAHGSSSQSASPEGGKCHSCPNAKACGMGDG